MREGKETQLGRIKASIERTSEAAAAKAAERARVQDEIAERRGEIAQQEVCDRAERGKEIGKRRKQREK